MSEALTRERVLYLFDVDVEQGSMIWRNPPKYHPRIKGKHAGRPCDGHQGKQYWVIKIDRRAYKRGRLIYLVAYGEWPSPCVDHINGNSLDDRIANLRQASVIENAWNHAPPRKQSRLPRGVKQMAPGRFNARITFCGRQLSLGVHKTAKEAHAIYCAKRKELYGEFA